MFVPSKKTRPQGEFVSRYLRINHIEKGSEFLIFSCKENKKDLLFYFITD